MGFRFRRSIKLFPGLRLNVSKSGVSTSIGRRGFTVNVKRGRATRTTVGLPGTGISYTATAGSRTPGDEPPGPSNSLASWLLVLLIVAALVFAFA